MARRLHARRIPVDRAVFRRARNRQRRLTLARTVQGK
jgi:hypothetical protein